MRKHTLNTIVDFVRFLCLLILWATGVIMYLVLPPGSREKAFLSLTRHDWGSIHFWTATVFTVTAALHLVLHYSWIVNSYNPFKKKRT